MGINRDRKRDRELSKGKKTRTPREDPKRSEAYKQRERKQNRLSDEEYFNQLFAYYDRKPIGDY